MVGPGYDGGLSPTEAAMSRRKKDPLRELTADERQELTRRARAHAAPAAEGIRAKLLLAGASGDDYQDAAHAAGRRSGDAVSQDAPGDGQPGRAQDGGVRPLAVRARDQALVHAGGRLLAEH